MYNTPLPTKQEIKKRHINDAILFAMDSIPEVDRATLETFWALVNTTGASESISKVQLIGLMHTTLKRSPTACAHSLLVVINLLEARIVPDGRSVGSPVIPSASQLGLVM